MKTLPLAYACWLITQEIGGDDESHFETAALIQEGR